MTTLTISDADRDTTPEADFADPDATAAGCAPCAHADEHGWWGHTLGTARSHCRRCHRSWRSRNEAHCTTCCAHFASPRVFDAHLTTDGCVDPAAATRRDGKPRFTTRPSPYGVTWRLAFYGDRPAHWAADTDTDADAA